MALKNCIKSTVNLDDGDVVDVLKAYEANKETGKTEKESVVQAVDSVIAMAKAERAEVVEQIEGQNPEPAFSREAEPEGKMTKVQVNQVVDKISQNVGAKIEVVSTESKLPKDILAQAEKEGATGEIQAVQWKGVLYIVADMMQDAKHIESSIAHEFQHFQGNSYFGKGRQRAYNTLWMKMGSQNGMMKMLKDAGINMRSYFETATDMDSDSKSTYLIDEFLAHIKGKEAYAKIPERIKKAIAEFRGKIRDLLRRSGFVELAKANDADVAFLLKKISESAVNSKQADNTTPQFMTSDMAGKYQVGGIITNQDGTYRRNDKGDISGAPAGVKNSEDIEIIADSFVEFVDNKIADAKNSHDWYKKSGDAINAISHMNDEVKEDIVRLAAFFSQANSVGGNTTALIKSLEQYARGDKKIFAGRFPNKTS